jgi:hypothetical protein
MKANVNVLACGDWLIWWRGDWTPYRDGKLINLRAMNTADKGRPGKGRRNFWIGWNGQAVMRNNDVLTLIKRYPGEIEKIEAFLTWVMPRPV